MRINEWLYRASLSSLIRFGNYHLDKATSDQLRIINCARLIKIKIKKSLPDLEIQNLFYEIQTSDIEKLRELTKRIFTINL